MTVPAANNTSTAPGDSGGPMFTVGPNNKVYLLGATLGSNFAQGAMLPDDPIQNNGATYLLRDGQLF